MAKIEVNCPTCGSVLCRGNDFTLRTWEGTGTYYIFSCPMCHETIQRLADDRTIDILVSEGAAPARSDVPAEFYESRGTRAGAPLTSDDLIDLHALLERDDWFNELTKQRDNA